MLDMYNISYIYYKKLRNTNPRQYDNKWNFLFKSSFLILLAIFIFICLYLLILSVSNKSYLLHFMQLVDMISIDSRKNFR